MGSAAGVLSGIRVEQMGGPLGILCFPKDPSEAELDLGDYSSENSLNGDETFFDLLPAPHVHGMSLSKGARVTNLFVQSAMNSSKQVISGCDPLEQQRLGSYILNVVMALSRQWLQYQIWMHCPYQAGRGLNELCPMQCLPLVQQGMFHIQIQLIHVMQRCSHGATPPTI